jgi:hypothetical protein
MRLTRILDPIRDVDTRTKVNDRADLATTSSPMTFVVPRSAGVFDDLVHETQLGDGRLR